MCPSVPEQGAHIDSVKFSESVALYSFWVKPGFSEVLNVDQAFLSETYPYDGRRTEWTSTWHSRKVELTFRSFAVHMLSSCVV